MRAGIRRLLVVAAICAAVLALLALPAAADNCGTPSDCFTTARAAVATAVGVGVLAAILSIGLDLSPLGTAKGIYEAFTGRDAITGEELSTFERFIGAVPVAGGLLGTGAAAVRLAGRVDDAADIARRVPAPNFSAAAARSNADLLANGGGVPRDLAAVQSYAERAGVGLDGVQVRLLDTPDEIAYLDRMGGAAFASDNTIFLGPASFADEETLVRVLAHERTHLYQQNTLNIADFDLHALEEAAYGIEDTFWRYFLEGNVP